MKRLLTGKELSRSWPDIWLLSAVLLIICIGLVMVASASVAVADYSSGNPMRLVQRQLTFAGIGLLVGYCALHIPIQALERRTFPMLALGILLLVLVLLPGLGHSVNGSQRWLGLGALGFQASEPARLFLLLYIAGYATRRQVQLATSWGGLFRPISFLMISCFLMLLEPDLGAGAILVFVAAIILFIAGARLFHIMALGACGAGLLLLMALISPYRMARLTSFSDPWAHPFASGFQLTQSLIAIGRGHLFGVGLGNSVQKLSYLPETHTDFLFAIYAEEFGLVGSLVLIGLFAIIIWRGFVIGRRALNRGQLFAGFVAYGLSAWLVLQAFVNMAVNMGLLPTKGLTLPLMSYGGSSLIMMCIVSALILRVSMENGQAAQGGNRGR